MLIVSSFGIRSSIISEKVREIFTRPESMNVLIIPFAGFDSDKTAAREITEGFIPFGFKQENIYTDIENISCNIDLIYVPGGNPFKLLKEAHQKNIMPLIRELIKKGSTYWGVSSGADFLCEDLSYLKNAEDDNFNLNSYKGLGIIKENVLCHCDQRDMGTIKRVREYQEEKKLLMLRNDEVYVISNSKREVRDQ